MQTYYRYTATTEKQDKINLRKQVHIHVCAYVCLSISVCVATIIKEWVSNLRRCGGTQGHLDG